MILIADSGSTKTDWRICQTNTTPLSFSTKGLNPHFTTTEDIQKEITHNFPKHIAPADIQTIYFYGAGCKAESSKQTLSVSFATLFPNAMSVIETDLVGAARALLGNKQGIAAILGTGMNIGYWDGSAIHSYSPSLGYILGDEGSGAYMGKKLMQAYFYNDLPADIMQDFTQTYRLSIEELIQKVYKEQYPNQFLASFVPFLEKHMHHSDISNIIRDAFRDFIQKHVLKISQKTQNFHIFVIGSVGFYFKDIFICECEAHSISVSDILKSPIERLCEYHRI